MDETRSQRKGNYNCNTSIGFADAGYKVSDFTTQLLSSRVPSVTLPPKLSPKLGPDFANLCRWALVVRPPRIASESKRMIQACRVLLLFVVFAMLTGCSLVVDSVRDAAEKKASVPAGTLIAGDGFTVRSPVEGLRVVRDQPRQGFLCLRFTTQLMFFGLGSYDIFPFSLDQPAPTLRDAWSANALTFFTAQNRTSYHILSEHTGTWQGQPAYFQAAYSPPFSHMEGFVIYSCLLRHGSKYYWVVRSVGLLNNQADTIQRARAQSEKQLPAFLNSLSFSNSPAT